MRTYAYFLLVALLPAPATAGEAPLVVTEDTVLDPGKTYGPIVVGASGVTIDGRGAWLLGAREGAPKNFRGVAIAAEGVSNVTLKNVKAKGWETALRVKDGAGWTVEGCDFSDNFHDPDFGWGENGRRGGIVLERVRGSTLRGNKANRVWDACVLVDSDDNTIVANDFSHTSNTCLKLWNSSRNEVRANNLSYGLRIKPGEVHARDSACLLIESGSDENRILDNDCTHGGDGVFVRVLNGWVSVGNVFEGNDASFANNNGFEAWSPRNIYRKNKANGCSYGFWLGASDQTVLEGNEASGNGDPKGFHNSPHLPGDGHAGIVFMFGPSSHTVVRNNRCAHNHGAGIALLGDEGTKGKAWKAFHWVLEDNTLTGNRWGIFARYADWLDLSGNIYRENSEADFRRDATVTNVSERERREAGAEPPRAKLDGPSLAKVGETIAFDASRSGVSAGRELSFRWDLGDGTIATTGRVTHAFAAPGFYRVGLTVTDGRSSDLDWRDLYVVDDGEETGTEGQSTRWSWADPQSKVAFADDTAIHLAGASSVRAEVHPYSGGRVTLVYEDPREGGLSLAGKTSLVFWIKTRNENIPGWQGPNPIVTLTARDGSKLRLTPKTDRMAQPPYTEAREGWTRFVVPLGGDAEWAREGGNLGAVTSLSIGLDSWGNSAFRVWIDGMGLR